MVRCFSTVHVTVLLLAWSTCSTAAAVNLEGKLQKLTDTFVSHPFIQITSYIPHKFIHQTIFTEPIQSRSSGKRNETAGGSG
jgi:hypothetical protein